MGIFGISSLTSPILLALLLGGKNEYLLWLPAPVPRLETLSLDGVARARFRFSNEEDAELKS